MPLTATVMAWYMVWVFNGIQLRGPFDSEQMCWDVAHHAVERSEPIHEKGFDHSSPKAWCVNLVRRGPHPDVE